MTAGMELRLAIPLTIPGLNMVLAPLLPQVKTVMFIWMWNAAQAVILLKTGIGTSAPDGRFDNFALL